MITYIILLVILLFIIFIFAGSVLRQLFNIAIIYYSIDLPIIISILIIAIDLIALFVTYKYLWTKIQKKFKIIGLPLIISLLLFIIVNYISFYNFKKYQKETIENYSGFITHEVLNKYEEDDFIILFNYESKENVAFLIKGNNTYVDLVIEKGTYNIVSEKYFYN